MKNVHHKKFLFLYDVRGFFSDSDFTKNVEFEFPILKFNKPKFLDHKDTLSYFFKGLSTCTLIDNERLFDLIKRLLYYKILLFF